MPAPQPRRDEPWAISTAARLYHAALRAYPRAFRRAWGEHLALAFRDGHRDAARAGRGQLRRYWLSVLRDLLGSAVAERWDALKGGTRMGKRDTTVGLLTILGAVAFCWLCLHTDETGILACSAMLLAGALGLANPRRAWLAALLIGLAAPAAQVLGHLLTWPVPTPHGPLPTPGDWRDVAGACVALVFSGFGAIGGAGVGWLLARANPRGTGLPG